MMFIRDADLSLIDDISSRLDIETQSIFWERFFDRRRTSIIVTHRQRTLELADHVLLVADGRMVTAGTFHWLFDNSSEMRSVGFL